MATNRVVLSVSRLPLYGLPLMQSNAVWEARKNVWSLAGVWVVDMRCYNAAPWARNIYIYESWSRAGTYLPHAGWAYCNLESCRIWPHLHWSPLGAVHSGSKKWWSRVPASPSDYVELCALGAQCSLHEHYVSVVSLVSEQGQRDLQLDGRPIIVQAWSARPPL